MVRRINLNHLVALIAVADAAGFRAAADRLHLTQSAVSSQIRALEERLGVSLFHRTTRSVRLTAEGRRLYTVARRTDREIGHVIEDLRASAALDRGRVEIASAGSVAASLLPEAIAAFRLRYPGIAFKVQDIDSTRVLVLVQSEEVDLGILSSLGPQRGVRTEPLLRDVFVAVVPATDHPLSRRAVVTLEELSRFPLLLNPPGAVLRDMVDRALRAAGLDVAPLHEAFSGLTLVAMVGHGLGVTVLPTLSLRGLDLSRCRVLQLRRPFGRQIVVARPSARSPSPATKAFLHFIRQRTASSTGGWRANAVPAARARLPGGGARP
ncbi:MAG: LysR family transcriptional regulator [Lautropia sp.]